MSISRRSLVGFAAALALWTAMAWFWVTVSGNAHVCSLLQAPTAAGQTEAPLTEAEQQEQTRQRCGPRASLGDILVFGTGYVVILGLFAVCATRPSEAASG